MSDSGRHLSLRAGRRRGEGGDARQNKWARLKSLVLYRPASSDCIHLTCGTDELLCTPRPRGAGRGVLGRSGEGAASGQSFGSFHGTRKNPQSVYSVGQVHHVGTVVRSGRRAACLSEAQIMFFSLVRDNVEISPQYSVSGSASTCITSIGRHPSIGRYVDWPRGGGRAAEDRTPERWTH